MICLRAEIHGTFPLKNLCTPKRRDREVDLRRYAADLGWHLPLGPLHVADFARLGDIMAAVVEVGNLMAGDSVDSLRPLDFAEDQHKLLAFGRNLPVATVLGIYVSQDLRSFKGVGGGTSTP